MSAEACYHALSARDPRFDGVFFVGVATTGIYCRPVCPARTPRQDRCAFFRSSAEAEVAGFRACFRCRPELAPGHTVVATAERVVERAVAQIEEGFLDEHGVDELAGGLGIGARHLRRTLSDALGASPVELAQTRRLALAKQLLQDTDMSLADIAFASGFGSVRRFNAAFAERFQMPPSDVRRKAPSEASEGICLRLDYRPPLAWTALLSFLKARAIPGVERVDDEAYERVVGLGGSTGTIRVTRDASRPALRVMIAPTLAPVLTKVVSRVRALFDLDARPDAIAERLSQDRLLRDAVRAQPGLRVPGSFDPFETMVRTILGQQVSVRGATTLSGRLVERFGEALEPSHARDGLSHLFPSAEALASTSAEQIAEVGLPKKRAQTIRALAQAFASNALSGPFRGMDVTPFTERLVAIPGIGPWTAAYVAMRVLHDPDAFPAGDLVLVKTLGAKSPKALMARAERWRPWRAYAAMVVWSMAATKGA